MSYWYDEVFLFGLSYAQVWTSLAPMVSGLVAAISIHFLSARQELKKVRKEWLAQRLEAAYLLLVDAVELPGMNIEQQLARKQTLLRAVNTVDLYGDRSTKKAATEIASAFAKGQSWVEYAPLQTALRDALRKNIGLEFLSDPVLNLQFSVQVPRTQDAG